MWTLGIDVAKYRHHATLLDEAGRTVFSNLSFAQSREGVAVLLERLAASAQAPESIRVGMEATGHYWMVLFEVLSQAGYTPELINPLVTSARRNITIRGTKTDSADAALIARLLREADLKVCAVAEGQVRQLRDLTRLRFECAHRAVDEKRRLLGLLDLAFPEYHDHFSDVSGMASRAVLEQFPTAEELAQVDIRRLTRLLREASRGRFGRTKAQRLKAAAKSSFALTDRREHLALEIRFVVERINLLLEQVAQLDRRMPTMLVDQQKLLQSIPGLGCVWAPTVLAEVLPFFHPEVQHGAKKLVAAAGLDARLRDSGEKRGVGKMSKRGSRYLRTAIMEAAQVAVFRRHDPLFEAVYKRQQERGKHHFVALSHVANKMLHVVFSVLKNNRPYTPMLADNNNA
jgi:transposase